MPVSPPLAGSLLHYLTGTWKWSSPGSAVLGDHAPHPAIQLLAVSILDSHLGSIYSTNAQDRSL